MQIAFITLTPVTRGDGQGGVKGGETTNLWVNTAHIIELDVIGGVTRVGTPIGFRRVRETPEEVLALLAEVARKANGDWDE